MPLHPWYALRFQYDFETKYGTEFQDFVGDVFDRRFGGDFFKIKPYGKQGDQKCDGIIKSLRKLLQVYAPQQMNSATTIAKIDADFPGAVTSWGTLFDEWVFVHNQVNGLPPDVAKHLIKIHGKDKKDVTHWCDSQILELVEQLSDGDLQAVLGPLPDFRNLSPVTAEDIRVVVTAVAQQTPTTEEISTVPSDKLDANALSGGAKALLRAGAQKSKNVGDLFEKWHDPELGDRIAAAFRKKYIELRNGGRVADEIFEELWRFAGGAKYLQPSKELATLALLAFLFEQCDIFEAAPKVEP
jgi:hypothetical protein